MSARYPHKTGPHVERLVAHLLTPPSGRPVGVRLEHSALAGYMELTFGDKQAFVTDDDLNELFLLITEHFAMEPSCSLGEHIAWARENSNQEEGLK